MHSDDEIELYAAGMATWGVLLRRSFDIAIVSSRNCFEIELNLWPCMYHFAVDFLTFSRWFINVACTLSSWQSELFAFETEGALQRRLQPRK
jgi:hypothetical protein